MSLLERCRGKISELLKKGVIGPCTCTEQSWSSFYSRYFLVPKQGEQDLHCPGFEGSERISQEIQIKDAHTCITFVPGAPGQLVHLDGSEECIFPYLSVSTTQKISEISSPFQTVTEPEGVCSISQLRQQGHISR